MELKCTIDLSPEDVKDMICKSLQDKGISVTPQNIMFHVSKIEKGSQIDPYMVYEFMGAKIHNVKVGK